LSLLQDITTDNKDEIVSDTFKLIEAGDGLWEVDCKMITKGAENFGQLYLADTWLLLFPFADLFQLQCLRAPIHPLREKMQMTVEMVAASTKESWTSRINSG
jgi:hypothetical protein